MFTSFRSEVMPSQYRTMVAEMAAAKKMPILINFALLYDEETVSEQEAEVKVKELLEVWQQAWGGPDWGQGMEEDVFLEPMVSYIPEEESDEEALADRGFIVALEIEYALELPDAIHLLLSKAPDLLDTPDLENQEVTETGDRLADPNVVRNILNGKRHRIELPEDE